MPNMYVKEARALAERLSQPQPVNSSDASITRLIVSIEEKNLIVRALNCLADVNSGDLARRLTPT